MGRGYTMSLGLSRRFVESAGKWLVVSVLSVSMWWCSLHLVWRHCVVGGDMTEADTNGIGGIAFDFGNIRLEFGDSPLELDDFAIVLEVFAFGCIFFALGVKVFVFVIPLDSVRESAFGCCDWIFVDVGGFRTIVLGMPRSCAMWPLIRPWWMTWSRDIVDVDGWSIMGTPLYESFRRL